MNRNEFVRFTNAETGLPLAQINNAIDIVTKAVIRALENGNDVKLVGFGTFKRKKRAERVGRNPSTKEAVKIPERVIPYFDPGNDMKNAVMGNK